MAFGQGCGDEARLDSGHSLEGLIEHGGAAGFGQYQPALGPGEHG
jgi:hypothetical protein